MASTTRAYAADVQITGILDMQQSEVTNLETDLSLYPLTSDQGATKVYVDSVKTEILNGLLTLADNGEF